MIVDDERDITSGRGVNSFSRLEPIHCQLEGTSCKCRLGEVETLSRIKGCEGGHGNARHRYDP